MTSVKELDLSYAFKMKIFNFRLLFNSIGTKFYNEIIFKNIYTGDWQNGTIKLMNCFFIIFFQNVVA